MWPGLQPLGIPRFTEERLFKGIEEENQRLAQLLDTLNKGQNRRLGELLDAVRLATITLLLNENGRLADLVRELGRPKKETRKQK